MIRERSLNEVLRDLGYSTRPGAREGCKVIVGAWVPIAWQAFTDYRLESVRLSRLEIQALGMILRGVGDEMAQNTAGLEGRERQEFATKLERMRQHG